MKGLILGLVAAAVVVMTSPRARAQVTLGANTNDSILPVFYVQNMNSSNLVQGVNINAGTNRFGYAALPAALQSAVAGGTNSVAMTFSQGWVTALATRLTNSNQRADLLLTLVFTNTQASQATISVEQNGAGGALTNTWVWSCSSTNAAVTTNSFGTIPVNPNAVVTVSSTGTGAGNGVALVASSLVGK